MARLALTVAGGIAGLALAPFTGGLSAALMWSIGSTVGGIIGALAFPGHGPHTYGPRVNDLQISTSAPGTPIPMLWGSMRYGGQIIAGSPLQEVTNTTSQSAKGGPSVTQTTYTYFVTFAAAFCQGPATITRVWGDSKLIYDTTGGTTPYQGPWDSSITYNPGDVVLDSSTYYLCRITNTNVRPSTLTGTVPYWSSTTAPVDPTIGQRDRNITIVPTLYSGSTAQLPDPTLVTLLGADNVPGYRGICYLVYEKLPLADFGNRLPNIRAEVTAVSTAATPEARAQINYDGTNSYPPAYMRTSLDGLVGFIQNVNGPALYHPFMARIDLTSNTTVVQGLLDASPINPVRTSGMTTYNVDDGYTGLAGSFIVDSNYDVWVAGRDTGGSPLIICYDGWTLKAKKFIPTTEIFKVFDNNATNVMNLYHANDGQEYIVMANDSSTYNNGVAVGVFQLGSYSTLVGTYTGPTQNTVQGLRLAGQYYNITVPQLNPTDTFQEPVVNQYMPALDQKGDFYFIWSGLHDDHTGNGYAAYDWYIAKVNMNGGVSDFVANGSPAYVYGNNHQYIGNSTLGIGIGMLYCNDDDTLIVLTDQGAIHKIDCSTMAIIQTVGGSTNKQFNTNSSIYFAAVGTPTVQNAQKAATANGVFFVPAVSGTNTLAAYNTNDLSLKGTYNIYAYPHMTSTGANLGQNTLCIDGMSNSILLPSAGWPVPDYGSGFPTKFAVYRLFLDRLSTSGVSADGIVKYICELAGIQDANIDVSQIAGLTVKGYPVAQIMPGKDMINTLATMLFFEGRETDFKLQFIPRGQSPLATISSDDLGLESDKTHITEMRAVETDIPKVVEVLYTDPSLDYQQGKQQRVRHSRTKKTKNVTSISTPVVMEAIQASQIADKILWVAEAEARSFKTSSHKASNMLYDPCDVINVQTDDGLTLAARITNATIGQNFASSWDLTSEDSNNYQSASAGSLGTGFVPQVLTGLSPTLFYLLDLPYLSDTDADATGNTGYYFTGWPLASGASWRGYALYDSTDDASFAQEGFATDSIAYGQITTALPAPRCPWSWDDVNTITVKLINGTAPASNTDANVLNGANGAILATSGEVIQFGTVTTDSDGTITLSHLLRGRRGTEWACGTSVAGERILFPQVQGGLHRNQVGQALIAQTRYWKAVTLGMDVNSQIPVLTYALEGNDLKPYSPQLAAATINSPSSNDWTIGWVRRTRLGGTWPIGSGGGSTTYTGVQVALSEDGQAYYIEITDSSGNVKRGAIVTSNRFVYTSAMQVTDFGANQTTLYFNLYQISAQVGIGFKSSWKITQSTTLPAVDTAPALANPTVSGTSGGSQGGFLVNGA